MRVTFLATLLLSAGAAFSEPVLILDVDGEAKGQIKIDLRKDLAPQHVERIVTLAGEGAYNNVAFHRVIDGFMAQTGDVEFGKVDGENLAMAGRGGSEHEDLPAEFSAEPFERGVVGMARSQNPNSANSQFFIMLAPARYLDGQYTVIGNVIEGQEIVDQIKKGNPNANGSIEGAPDYIVNASIEE